MSSVKGSWNRVKDLEAWGKNWEKAFKKSPRPRKAQESHKSPLDQNPPSSPEESF